MQIHAMKPYEISFNSRADLERQISAFCREHPSAKLDEAQINRARTLATKMDNDGKPVGERACVTIDYTDT
jgi:hypothetical protein